MVCPRYARVLLVQLGPYVIRLNGFKKIERGYADCLTLERDFLCGLRINCQRRCALGVAYNEEDFFVGLCQSLHWAVVSAWEAF